MELIVGFLLVSSFGSFLKPVLVAARIINSVGLSLEQSLKIRASKVTKNAVSCSYTALICARLVHGCDTNF